MREIQKDVLLNYINSLSSPIVCENIIHVLFQRFGKERDVDVIKEETLEIEEVKENKDEEK